MRRVSRGAGRSVGRGSCRLAIEPRKRPIPGADSVTKLEGNTSRRVIASVGSTWRGQRPQHAWTLLVREPGDLVAGRWCGAPSVRAGKAKGPKPVMNGDEKSDPTIVAMKPANEPLRRGKEWAELRVGAEGNVRGSARGPGAGPGSLVNGDRSRTGSGTRKERRKVYHLTAPHRRGVVAPGLLLAEARRGARCGWDDLGRLRETAWRRGCATSKAVSILVPTGQQSRACVPTSRNQTAGNGRWASRSYRTSSSNAPWSRFSMRSTSRTLSASPTGSGPGRGQHDALDALAVPHRLGRR